MQFYCSFTDQSHKLRPIWLCIGFIIFIVFPENLTDVLQKKTLGFTTLRRYLEKFFHVIGQPTVTSGKQKKFIHLFHCPGYKDSLGAVTKGQRASVGSN